MEDLTSRFLVPSEAIDAAVAAALAEDAPWGDLTTEAAGLDLTPLAGRIVTRQTAVISGGVVLDAVFRTLDPNARITLLVCDGETAQAGEAIADIECATPALLRGERVALNLLQRMSATATLTHTYVEAVTGTKARIVDTRKTTPGLRQLEKYAVRCGGGSNHRYSLSDAVLVKDNHLAALARQGVELAEALASIRRRMPFTAHLEVEVDSLEQLEIVLAAQCVDSILIDNFDIGATRRAVALAQPHGVLINASGGITLTTVREVAEAGVDLISVGALTHSAPAIDIGLDIAD